MTPSTTTALAPRGEVAVVEARATIAAHSRSFALASRVLPPWCRDQAAVVYTWCRRADDAVDERPPAEQPAALTRLRAELDDVYAGRAADPVLSAFGRIVAARAIPRHYPDELLAGMAMDVDGTRYATVDELRRYCYRVAGVVGLMMSHVMGVRDDRALHHAAHLGIAMQLTNVCRDVAEDWARGRLYVPDDLLAAHGAGGLAGDLGGPLPRAAVAPLGRAVAELLAIADRHYRSGDRGIRALPWRCALGVRAARSIYAAIGARIAAARHDVTAGRAVVSTPRKVALLAGAVARTIADAPARGVARLRGARARVPTTVLELADVAPL